MEKKFNIYRKMKSSCYTGKMEVISRSMEINL